MLTPQLVTPLATPSATWRSRSVPGRRHHQADAAAGYASPHTRRVAVAVADGVGDSADAAATAALVADHAVRVAALEGRVDTAVLATHDLLLAAGDFARGDAAVVVALGPAAGRVDWVVGWVGDCRAYAWDGHRLRVLTADHTVGAEMRAVGIAANPSLDHVLTRSVRTVSAPGVGVAAVSAPRALLLVSDGVHRAVGPDRLTALVAGDGTAAERAARVVAAADAAGTTDNATALVLDVDPVERAVPAGPAGPVGAAAVVPGAIPAPRAG